MVHPEELTEALIADKRDVPASRLQTNLVMFRDEYGILAKLPRMLEDRRKALLGALKAWQQRNVASAGK